MLFGGSRISFGRYLMWNKHSNFEQATRSPPLFMPQDQKPGKFTLAEFIISSQHLQFSKYPVPNNLDGLSLLPLMTGSAQSIKKYAISQYQNHIMGYSLGHRLLLHFGLIN